MASKYVCTYLEKSEAKHGQKEFSEIKKYCNYFHYVLKEHSKAHFNFLILFDLIILKIINQVYHWNNFNFKL